MPSAGPNAHKGEADFNKFAGFAVSPALEGSCNLFLEHIRDVVCSGDADSARWVIMWLADIVQNPRELPGTALVLVGVQGAGKSIVGEIMGAMLGEQLYVVVPSVEKLTGRFNAHMEGRLLTQVDEGFFAGDPTIVGDLKSKITSPTVLIERKGIDSIAVANCARVLITSNEMWVVPAENGERRFMVLEVSDTRANDLPYFGALREQMFENGGLARLFHYLLHEVEVDKDFIRRPIKSDALRDQQIQSLRPEKRWLLRLLMEGALPGDQHGVGKVLTTELYANYTHSLREYGAARRISDTMFGKLLAQYGVDRKRERTGVGDERRYFYYFPPLSKCRATFDRELATPLDWDGTDAWQKAGSVSGVYA